MNDEGVVKGSVVTVGQVCPICSSTMHSTALLTMTFVFSTWKEEHSWKRRKI